MVSCRAVPAPDIAIVGHESADYLLALLTSLEPVRAAAQAGAVHVWDNASTDRTAELLAAYGRSRSWLHAHRSPINLHHGPALDILLAECCRAEWVLLLDADTEIVRPWDAALAACDLRGAAFVGQIHPQMPHLYAYLSHLLVHRPTYLELPPFCHHGAPGIDYFRAVEDQRRRYVRFRWCDYVRHAGQGSLRRIAARGDRGNSFYAFARDEVHRHPSTPERLAHEARLGAELDAFLASASAHANAPIENAPRHEVVAPAERRRPAARTLGGWTSGRRGWLQDAAGWIRTPRMTSAMRAARRLGLVQRPPEARALVRLLQAQRPARVIEVGTAHGGSFLLWARAAAPDATLVSVDLPPWELDDPAEAAKRRALERVGRRGQSVHVIRGDSHDGETRRRALDCVSGSADFVFIDGDHSYDGVKQDFQDYASAVPPGGIVALHDIQPHSRGWGGEVPAFWREIRGRYRHAELVADAHQDGFGIGVLWIE